MPLADRAAAVQNGPLRSSPAPLDARSMEQRDDPAEVQALERWCKQHPGALGQYVSMQREVVIGPYSSKHEAQRAGFDRFGRTEFYVLEVGAPAPPAHMIF